MRAWLRVHGGRVRGERQSITVVEVPRTPMSPSRSMSAPVTFSARLTADSTRLLIGICT